MSEQPLGMPPGSVRSLISISVIVAAAAMSGYLLVNDASSDLAKITVGGWIAALGNVIGFYFGTRRET